MKKEDEERVWEKERERKGGKDTKRTEKGTRVVREKNDDASAVSMIWKRTAPRHERSRPPADGVCDPTGAATTHE